MVQFQHGEWWHINCSTKSDSNLKDVLRTVDFRNDQRIELTNSKILYASLMKFQH